MTDDYTLTIHGPQMELLQIASHSRRPVDLLPRETKMSDDHGVMCDCDPCMGIERRDTGMARVMARTDPEWIASAEQLVLELLDAYGRYSSNDIRREVGMPCTVNGDDKPNALGAFTRRMSTKYGLQIVDWEQPIDAKQQGRRVPVWGR